MDFESFAQAESKGSQGVWTAYHAELKARMSAITTAPELQCLPDLKDSSKHSAFMLAPVSRLLNTCLPTSKPGDILRYMLAKSEDDNDYINRSPSLSSIPSLAELGLNTRRAQVLGVGLLRIFSSSLLPPGLSLLRSTTPSTLIPLITGQLSPGTISSLLDDASLTAEFRQKLIQSLGLAEQDRVPETSRPFPPFLDLHQMHHDRLRIAGVLPNLLTKHVLLVGASGFLGSCLLDEILASEPWVCVHCLMRAKDTGNGLGLSRLKALAAKRQVEVDWKRVRVIVGDVSAPLLGMKPVAYERLSGRVDVIYVSIASSRSDRPCSYEEAKEVHVTGVRQLLSLAASHHRKTINYVSCLGTLTDDLFGKEGWAVGQCVHNVDHNTQLRNLTGW